MSRATCWEANLSTYYYTEPPRLGAQVVGAAVRRLVQRKMALLCVHCGCCRLLNLLTTKLYTRYLFSRPADSLEQSTSTPSEYMIIDNTPSTNTYISVPKEMNQLSVAAYIAGIIEGVCDAAGFECKVSAHNQATDVLAQPNRVSAQV